MTAIAADRRAHHWGAPEASPQINRLDRRGCLTASAHLGDRPVRPHPQSCSSTRPGHPREPLASTPQRESMPVRSRDGHHLPADRASPSPRRVHRSAGPGKNRRTAEPHDRLAREAARPRCACAAPSWAAAAVIAAAAGGCPQGCQGAHALCRRPPAAAARWRRPAWTVALGSRRGRRSLADGPPRVGAQERVRPPCTHAPPRDGRRQVRLRRGDDVRRPRAPAAAAASRSEGARQRDLEHLHTRRALIVDRLVSAALGVMSAPPRLVAARFASAAGSHWPPPQRGTRGDELRAACRRRPRGVEPERAARRRSALLLSPPRPAGRCTRC
jgi:hypothetical protein